MRTFRALLLVICFLGGPFPGFAVLAQSSTQSVDDSRLSLTKDVMNEMAGGSISSVCDRFTPDLKDTVTEDKLQFAWNRLIGVSGAFLKQLSQSTRSIHGTTIYVAKSQFEDSKVELRLTFDEKNQISRIWIAPISDLSPQTMESLAKDVVGQLNQKQFEPLTDRFSNELKVRMPPERLEMSWSHVLAHLGEFKGVKLASKDEELDYVDVTCGFESGEIIVRVAFDPSGKIGGLWMLPVETSPDENPKI